MYKTPEGITMHDSALCIGCRMCQNACPYSALELNETSLAGETYSVISFNAQGAETQPQWSDASVLIPGCTASGAETAKAAGATAPAMNQFVPGDVQSIRKAGIVENCTFCYHRVSTGLKPARRKREFSATRTIRNRRSPRSSRRRSRSASRRRKARSRTSIMSASTAPAPERTANQGQARGSFR